MSNTTRWRLAIVALMGALVGAVAGQEARAADMTAAPILKAPMRAPIYDWTGFYLGINGGGSAGKASTDASFTSTSFLLLPGPTPLGSASQFLVGGLGGAQAGYNWQTNAVVLGLEADIQATGEKGDTVLPTTVSVLGVCALPCVPPPPTPTAAVLDFSQKLPWFGTARARVGYTPMDRWLVYATGGLAYGEIKTDATVTSATGLPSTASFNQDRAGWVAGAGVEAALGGAWTGKVEYLHLDLGSFSYTFMSNTFPLIRATITATSHVTDDIVRVGVNYRVGAKY